MIAKGGRDDLGAVRLRGGSRGFLVLSLAECGGLCATEEVPELPSCGSAHTTNHQLYITCSASMVQVMYQEVCTKTLPMQAIEHF